MNQYVLSFSELDKSSRPFAGGKGGMLARMFQDSYPVPDGFVILPSAFHEDELKHEAWTKIQVYLNAIRKKYREALFAVRSSALCEDSAQASFAGEFETVLSVKTDEDVHEAIYTVYRSRQTERVKAYSMVQGMEEAHQIAIVVQLMVPSEISGVLFTADPITGTHVSMIGNYVYGLGELLVSGEANAYSFKFVRPKGKYDGPDEFAKYATKLYTFADRLEKQLDCPQDIEWAVAKGKLYILQARPITTLRAGNLDTYEINESLTGDFLWVNTNIGEAIPDVMTPLTWTSIRLLDNEISTIPGYYIWSGNICGRAYTNINMRLSIWNAFGMSAERGVIFLKDILGDIPEGMRIPIYPFSQLGLLKVVIPRLTGFLPKLLKAWMNLSQFLRDTPDWCQRMTAHINKVKTKEELLSLWQNELYPYNSKAWFTLLAGTSKAVLVISLSKELINLVGTEDANILLSNLRENFGIASLGPVLGISKVVQGRMTREEYLAQYGHRGPHEFELSIPHPAENAEWLEKQIEEFERSNTDVEGLLIRQHARYERAWERFQQQFPGRVNKIKKQTAKASKTARLREAVRSEFVRVFRVNRAFALRAGELTGIGDDVFFLYLAEILNLLSGDNSAVRQIPARKETYNRYKTLPPFPSIIRGRFDPLQWVKDLNRRNDYYDATIPYAAFDSETLKGFAGAAGIIEGYVRVLTSPEEGEMLQAGEILVASTTNVGWTPLFPKAAAIITDIGAPLSHAAIVARELGIPAVVGCSNATSTLKTGHRVVVDGGHGVVQILNRNVY